MQHVFLIGLSGSGKSTVGRLLAQRLGRPLLDIDALIEQEYGERIPVIFSRHGEAYFRSLESHILARAIQRRDDAIIVTGGGIVVQSENRALMAQHGIRVFMQVAPHISLARLQAQHISEQQQGYTPEIRPLLSGPDPLMNLQAMLTAREPWYREAEVICSTQDKSVEQIAMEIITMLTDSKQPTGVTPVVRHVHIGAGYDAVVAWEGLQHLPEYLQQLQVSPRVFIVTDSNLHDKYIPSMVERLVATGFEAHVYAIPAGEGSKSQQQLFKLYDWLLEYHAERRETIIALGGGVVGDLVGFVASTYLRGVPLIQIPTSLLSQVDAAIGGKTGINHPRGKNLIGSFYHPQLVLVDPSVLLSLPERSRTEGWAEIVKYGIILDAELFTLLEVQADVLREFFHVPIELLCQIIARCIDLKVTVIENDEREQGLRAILNYGHTFAHALENVSGYGEWLHGEAVSVGMVVAATLAQEAGLFVASDVNRQNRLLVALGLPTTYTGTANTRDILDAMQLDKKVVGKRVRWIMPKSIGEVVAMPLPDELVERVVTSFIEEK
jgi:shikimate kinase / 3-dehydroquinate synthase